MLVSGRNAMLEESGGVGPVESNTRFEMVCTSANQTVGIYSTVAISPSAVTVVDWGDGSADSITGNISELTHTYAAAGTYEVTVTDSITSIALENSNGNWNKNLKRLVRILDLASTITSIPAGGFSHLENLAYAYLGTGTLVLGDGAFKLSAMSSPATEIDLSGRTITEIPASCFEGNIYLKTVKWPSSLTTIGDRAFSVAVSAATTPVMTTITIPEGVTSLGASAFLGNASNQNALTKVTLPSTLTSIGSNCFARAAKLRNLTIKASTAPSTSTYVFQYGTSGYTGASQRGQNLLVVPPGATGYTTGEWADPLCNASKCGFTKVDNPGAVFTASIYHNGDPARMRTIGIYSAAAIDPTVPIVVDWGDGSTDTVTGNISQLTHTYAYDASGSTAVNYTITVSDNISSFALSANNSTWYGTTTANQQRITGVLYLSPKVETIPVYAFAHCEYLTYFDAGPSGNLQFAVNASGNSFAFLATSYYSAGTWDLGGRTCTSIPAATFNDTGMKTLTWPQGITRIEDASSATNGAFWYDGYILYLELPATLTLAIMLFRLVR